MSGSKVQSIGSALSKAPEPRSIEAALGRIWSGLRGVNDKLQNITSRVGGDYDNGPDDGPSMGLLGMARAIESDLSYTETLIAGIEVHV